MRIKELSKELAKKAEAYCEHLLPNGQKMGGTWAVGGIDGVEGQSLRVNLAGDSAGQWQDFASTGVFGDLLDLTAKAKDMPLREAVEYAAKWAGITLDHGLSTTRRYTEPEKPQVSRPKGAVLDWLFKRGLSQETIDAYKLGANSDTVYFPCIDQAGKLQNYKSRNIHDKTKQMQAKGARPTLFGWPVIPKNTRTLYITEGEIDAMSLYQVGFAAVSVPAGANNHEWISTEWDNLELFEEIVICFDSDEPGKKGAAEIARRLGEDRCVSVTFPGCKDANEYLLATATPEDFKLSIAAGTRFEPQELFSAQSYAEEFYAISENKQENDIGKILLGGYLDGVVFKPGDISVWTGINGHGKSEILGQVLLGLMLQKQKVAVFSAELTGGRQLYRLCRQVTGQVHPEHDLQKGFLKAVEGRYYVFDPAAGGRVEPASVARIIEVFTYAAKRHGVTHVVIDSLMATDVPEDGEGALSKQRAAINALSIWAKAHHAHVHLVAHPRKVRDENSAPGKMDISGSGKLTDRTDNLFAVWSAGKEQGDGEPDGCIQLMKQRNGDLQRKTWPTWFDRTSRQTTVVKDVVFSKIYLKGLLGVDANVAEIEVQKEESIF